MLTRVFVAGEDAAHLNFVSGFLSAFDYPPGRITLGPSDVPRDPGRIGDGKERMFADAREAAKTLWSRRNHETSVLVLLHDLDDEELVSLRRRVLARVASEGNVDLTFLTERSVLIAPEPETEGWIAAMLNVGYVPTHSNTKSTLKRQAFHFGKEAGRTCRRGERDKLPEQIRSFCEEVERHMPGLR